MQLMWPLNWISRLDFSYSAAQVIGQYTRVVEGQLVGQVVEHEHISCGGIVSGNRWAFGSADKHGGNSVKTRIPIRRGVHAQKPDKLDMQPCFLFCFPYCCLFNSFSVIYKTAWYGPPVGRILSFNQYDPRSSIG
jgi:hypothetical protein